MFFRNYSNKVFSLNGINAINCYKSKLGAMLKDLIMRQLTIILITFLIHSCNSKSDIVNANQALDNNSGKAIDSYVDNSLNDTITTLSDVFQKAVKTFPNDSASLYRFYYEWFPAKDTEKLNQQIERLKKLTSKESVERYNKVNNKLKPLLIKITKTNSINQSQVDTIVTLYSDYDYFSGESLFSQLLTNDDNYNLVWKSFQIMANESNKDTCYISALIELDKNISINVELAEAMPEFVIKAIKNNPIGFLEIFKQRQGKEKIDLANYIIKYDEPEEELINVYTDIFKNSKNAEHRLLAKELIEKIK
ncbi:MAG: hypothetical protein GXX85_12115 [Ignavibacteria bacterium]|nr:hypothetical protein [Ignavibacteria bacterium]